MEFLHCNRCGHLPQHAGQDHRRYVISSCGHLFCQNCAIHSKETCVICKANCRLVEINAQSKPDIKAYFMDPLTLLRDSLKQTTLVFNFQKSQQKSFQSIIGRLMEAHKRAIAEIDTLKKDLEALREENQTLKRKIEAMEQEHQNWIGSGLNNPNIGGTSSFTVQTLNEPSTPRNSFASIFGAGDGSSCNARGMVTPANQTSPFALGRNGLFTPTPPSTTFSSYSQQVSSGGTIRYGPGRLTIPRTPTSEETSASTSQRFESPAFSLAPGAGRPSSNMGQTPDIVARLRQLRCSAASSTPGNATPSRSYMQ